MNWLKKQLIRAKSIIVQMWTDMIFEFVDDTCFTKFGKIIFIVSASVIMSIWTILLIIFMPLILAVLKDDE